MSEGPVAFFSYVRKADRGKILTRLAATLQDEVELRGVEGFSVFVDVEEIRWGEPWQERLGARLDAASLLIPVILPAYFQRPWCREELQRFLTVRPGRPILPVLWMETPGLSKDSPDELVREIAIRNWVDWSSLQYGGLETEAAGRAIGAMGARIAHLLLGPPVPATSTSPTSTPVATDATSRLTPSRDLGPLNRLLTSLFSADELRRFVRYGPRGDEIASRLPSASASLASLSDAVIEAYGKEGMIDAELFRRLAAERPRRKPDIDAVRIGLV